MEDMRKGTCPICNHNEILEAKPADVVGGHQIREIKKKVTPGARGWVLTGSSSNDHYGPLTVYVCRSCGFAQWFAADPESIPASEYFQTRIIKGAESEGPFR